MVMLNQVIDVSKSYAEACQASHKHGKMPLKPYGLTSGML